MHILVLSKRYPQGRDLLNRPYGRFFHLPYYLSQLKHQITLVLLSYSNETSESRQAYGMDWHSVSLRPWSAGSGCLSYIAKVKALIEADPPDWIIGFSDTWYGILAQHLGKRYGIRTMIDAYDNYESYIPIAKPLHWAWRRSCRSATALTAAGPDLLELIAQGKLDGRTAIIPMAADPLFRPLERDDCRRRLTLPSNNLLIGYCGSLYRNRDVETLFEAFAQLYKMSSDVRLVLSGRRQKGITIPSAVKDYIIDLGYITDDQMPWLLNAMDVLLTINRPSPFGHYSYPAKVYEAMQCEIPVVAIDTLSTRWLLRSHPECVVPHGNAVAMAERAYEALSWKRKTYSGVQTWQQSAQALNELLLFS